MKSPQCKLGRWCDHCEMVECDCACHNFADVAQGSSTDAPLIEANGDAGSSPAVSSEDQIQDKWAPPQHPLPFDHGKYRVADEQPGTDRTQPWVLDYCIYCKEPTWTHNVAAAGRYITTCEACATLMVLEYHEKRVEAENRRPPYVNIFGR